MCEHRNFEIIYYATGGGGAAAENARMHTIHELENGVDGNENAFLCKINHIDPASLTGGKIQHLLN